ncbi:MAG: hypothetical protein JSV67_04310, partial [Thermoplasmatales archaeon]
LFLFFILFFCCLSGCIFEDIIGGSDFKIDSWTITTSEGFPAIYLSYQFSEKITLELIDPYLNRLDYDFFYHGKYKNRNTSLNIGKFRKTPNPGQYSVKVYDKDNKLVTTQMFSLTGPSLSIISCDQNWWSNRGTYHLVGLKMLIHNSGDTPVYPYSVEMVVNTEVIGGYVLPNVVLPGENRYVQCYIYKKDIPSTDSFTIYLNDWDENTLATANFLFDIKPNISTRTFEKGLENELAIPNINYLFSYYSDLERITVEDCGVFIFDIYDDLYIDFIVDLINNSMNYREFKFDVQENIDKINYIAGFVQGLSYKPDSLYNDSFEYPRYPIETLYNNGGDCEDKAILTASLLTSLGFEVALFRLPNHMAVGVNLSKEDNPGYQYYYDTYFFLETTNEGNKCGSIPKDYRDTSELTVYKIESRPFIFHDWKDGVITIYSNTERGDYVKVISFIENLGNETAENIIVEGVFITDDGLKLNSEKLNVGSLEPYDKKKLSLSVIIPKGFQTKFETRVFVNSVLVDTEMSKDYFD